MHYMPSILTLTAAICASGSVAFADPVEVKLSDRLDGNLDFYCFDISGAKEDANVAQGLQTHTCYGYQGESGIDQIFDSARIAQAQFYMPEFDVCATVSSYSAGTSVDLATCDGSDGQAIVMTDAGNISPWLHRTCVSPLVKTHDWAAAAHLNTRSNR